MVSILEGSLAQTIGRAASFIFMDATLTVNTSTPGPDRADPLPPTTATYTCKAIEQEYSSGVRGQGLVGATDIEVLILASTLSVEPKSGNRITIRNRTVTIVPMSSAGIKAVQSDPARATWLCRCSI